MTQSFPDAVWFKFESEVDLVTQSEYGGRRLVYRGGLGEPPEPLNRAQIIDIDIGTGDPITPSPLVINTPTLLGSEIISWQVYPVETILAEKLHSLVTKGSANSRAKDIFDVWLLLSRADQKTLKKALKATFSYREDVLPKNIGGLLKEMDQSLLKKGWKSAASYVRSAKSFDVTIFQVIEALENWGI